ncbi:MAG: domain containing protein [Myxococcales bacterium]|nr:domain containing protein [Myxococcales bacterium]
MTVESGALPCLVCRQGLVAFGVLCAECQEKLASPPSLAAEQLQVYSATPTGAALVDSWGRLHRLDPRANIGREVDGQGLAIREPSVSRRHATVTFENKQWTLRDLGSSNGTFVNDDRLDEPTVLSDGDRLGFGEIELYFVPDTGGFPGTELGWLTSPTVRPLRRTLKEPPENPATPRFVTFKLHEPTGGGGGFLEIDGKQIQLTTVQLEFMALLIARMSAGSEIAHEIRGFVRSTELVENLSWETSEPSENHVKQLVRRLRRVFIKAGIGDLIESRHRSGYRLAVKPPAH